MTEPLREFFPVTDIPSRCMAYLSQFQFGTLELLMSQMGIYDRKNLAEQLFSMVSRGHIFRRQIRIDGRQLFAYALSPANLPTAEQLQVALQRGVVPTNGEPIIPDQLPVESRPVSLASTEDGGMASQRNNARVFFREDIQAQRERLPRPPTEPTSQDISCATLTGAMGYANLVAAPDVARCRMISSRTPRTDDTIETTKSSEQTGKRLATKRGPKPRRSKPKEVEVLITPVPTPAINEAERQALYGTLSPSSPTPAGVLFQLPLLDSELVPLVAKGALARSQTGFIVRICRLIHEAGSISRNSIQRIVQSDSANIYSEKALTWRLSRMVNQKLLTTSGANGQTQYQLDAYGFERWLKRQQLPIPVWAQPCNV